MLLDSLFGHGPAPLVAVGLVGGLLLVLAASLAWPNSRLTRALDHLEEWLIAVLLVLGTLLIFVAVVQRYSLRVPALYDFLANRDLPWAQELCIYMFVWMAKFGAAYGVRTGIHVGVDVLVNTLGNQTRRKVILFGLLCGALFTGIVGTLGFLFVYELSHTTQVSNDLEVPQWITYLAIPLGSYLMCFRFLQVVLAYLRTGELPRHDHGHVEGLEDDNSAKPAGVRS